MWLWLSAYLFEILVFVATAVEATALVYLYRLERRQFDLEEGRNRIDLRVDIDFAEGQIGGVPSIWIENAGAGSGFIESAELIVMDTEAQKTWKWKCKMAGNRKLPGFASNRVDLVPALSTIGSDAWTPARSSVKVELFVSVLVLVDRRDQLQRNSGTYRSSIMNRAGNLSELIPVAPSVTSSG